MKNKTTVRRKGTVSTQVWRLELLHCKAWGEGTIYLPINLRTWTLKSKIHEDFHQNKGRFGLDKIIVQQGLFCGPQSLQIPTWTQDTLRSRAISKQTSPFTLFLAYRHTYLLLHMLCLPPSCCASMDCTKADGRKPCWRLGPQEKSVYRAYY